MRRRRGDRSSCFGISMYDERRWRGDEEEMKRRARLSQTYGFWRLARRPVLDSFGKTSRSHKGASRPVFLLSVTFRGYPRN
jgi:hypothetical protein